MSYRLIGLVLNTIASPVVDEATKPNGVNAKSSMLLNKIPAQVPAAPAPTEEATHKEGKPKGSKACIVM